MTILRSSASTVPALFLYVPSILEAVGRLARLLQRWLLVANDGTANPYSFIPMSGLGHSSVVLVDPGELDKNNRYVIVSATPVANPEI